MDQIDELKRIFENRTCMSENRFVGRTCMGRIDRDLMGKIEFDRSPMDFEYSRLKVSVIERTRGIVDPECGGKADSGPESRSRSSSR